MFENRVLYSPESISICEEYKEVELIYSVRLSASFITAVKNRKSGNVSIYPYLYIFSESCKEINYKEQIVWQQPIDASTERVCYLIHV